MATASTETQSRELDIQTARLSSRRGLVEESRRALVGSVLLLVDMLALSACLVTVWFVRSDLLPIAFPSLAPLYPLSFYFRSLYFFAPWIVALAAARLYARHTNFWDELRAIARASTWGTIMAVVLSYTEHSEEEIARTLIAILWLVSVPALAIARNRTKTTLAALGLWRRPILVIGAGDTAVSVASDLRADAALGYDPVAFVGCAPVGAGETISGLPTFGPLDAIPQLIDALAVRDVIIAMPEESRESLATAISLCEGRVDSLRVVPDLVGMAVTDLETETVGGNLLISMRSNLARPTNLVLKKATDLVGAIVLLVPVAPLLALLAIWIRLDSKGPAFYVQERVGRHGSLFPCIKFRTMYLDADSRLARHLEADAVAREEWEHFKKLKSFDPRVTRVGKHLRRLSLDELPQLLNVLLGHMSLVGPRPYIEHELAGHEEIFRTILLASPGITGLWQVSGRNELRMAQRLRLDEYYVRNWSLWLDLQILVRTVGVLARSEGAY